MSIGLQIFFKNKKKNQCSMIHYSSQNLIVPKKGHKVLMN